MGAITVRLDDQDCLNPSLLFDEATRLGWDVSHWHGKANSFHLPSGRTPGYGWILLKKKQVDVIKARPSNSSLDNETGIDDYHTLTFSDGSNTATLKSILVVSCRALYGNKISTPSDETAYLLELADIRRYNLFSYTDRYYNVRCPDALVDPVTNPADPTDGYKLYYAGSVDYIHSLAWTWQGIANLLWNDLPLTSTTRYATCPTLPYTPSGIPENYIYRGINGWDALNDYLDTISCILSYNPIADTFSFQKTGDTQSGLSSSWDNLSNRFWSDQSAVPCLRANRPNTVNVCFHVKSSFFGTEVETNAISNWLDGSSSPYVINKDISGVGFTPSAITIYDSLPAIYDSGTTNYANDTALQARATEVANNYKATLATSETYLDRQIIGIVKDILPGSEIKLVSWLDIGSGLVTEFKRYPSPTINSYPSIARTPELGGYQNYPSFSSRETGGRNRLGNDSIPSYFSPRDIATQRTLEYPTKLQIVRLTSSTPNSDGLIPGIVVTFPPNVVGVNPNLGYYAYVDQERCWISLLKDTPSYSQTYDIAATGAVVGGDYHLARLVSWFTHSGDTRPVYVIEPRRRIVKIAANSNWKKPSGPIIHTYVPVTLGGVTVNALAPSLLSTTPVNNGVPNIVSGQDVLLEQVGTDYYVVYPDLDEPLLTIKWHPSGTNPFGAGWGKCDGSGNASPGGDGIDRLSDNRLLRTGTGGNSGSQSLPKTLTLDYTIATTTLVAGTDQVLQDVTLDTFGSVSIDPYITELVPYQRLDNSV